MIGRAPPEAFGVLAAILSGAFVLVWMVVRELRGRPVVPKTPLPFQPVDPVGMVLLGFGLFFAQAMLGPLLVRPEPAARAAAVVVGVNLGGFAALFVARRVLRTALSPERSIGYGVLVAWAALPVVYGSFRLITGLAGHAPLQEPVKDIGKAIEHGATQDWIWYAAFAVLVAPLVEETVFRGLLYPALRRRLGVRGAVVLSSALFGLVHGLSHMAPLAILGVFLAFLVERTGALIACVAAHMAFNALTVAQLLGG